MSGVRVPSTALRGGNVSAHIVAGVALYLGEHPGRVTVREIAKATGHSSSTTFHALKVLRDAGVVEWSAGFSGTMRSRVSTVNTDSV